MSGASYNERSWAIDLIGYIKHLANESNRSIKDAGGEQTIKAEGGSLFPDVLLFGDRSTAKILQGWELKMPDTGIDDFDFQDNAEQKARTLGLDSFLLWNVRRARLFIQDESGEFCLDKEWSDLDDIASRSSVLSNRSRWEKLASEIISYLNDLFDRGSLEGRQFIDAYRSGGVTAMIMENSGLVADALLAETKKNSAFKAQVTLWWEKYSAEYGKGKATEILGQAVLSNWIGKLLFAHILREKDQRAKTVDKINDETTPKEALVIFKKLSDDCNFWTIFSEGIGLELVPAKPWDQLKQFNHLLADLRVGSVAQSQLSEVLEATVEVAKRKLRGQYTTPIELARLLISISMKNPTEDRVLDPCCGSGTIARAALEQKFESGVSADNAAASVFAGDQDPQAIQIATFALAKPDMMNKPLRLFQRDAFDLEPETSIEFRDPTNGKLFSEKLGQFHAITSNLPFVAQSGRKQYGNAIARVSETFGDKDTPLPGRADVAAYLPFSLWPLLHHRGRLGIIITNAWLGTDWGDAFYQTLNNYYDLKAVITSGAGRWFQNSDVVTNILLMEKRKDTDKAQDNIHFIVLTRPIEEVADAESVAVTAAQIELAQSQNDTMTIRSISRADLNRFRKYGLGGNAQFVNCDWILEAPLVPLRDLCLIRRGERRGMNDLFYPASGHGIEKKYIKPLAKSARHFKRLKGSAAKEAFSCGESEAELKKLGHTGALNWIKRFKTRQNIAKLSKTGAYWYEMSTDAMSELVMAMAYSDRLFIARLDPPAFADQRLIRLDQKSGVDLELLHALLNSAVSMFIIEGIGFGRGLGALDLNKDRIETYLHVLDPSKLTAAQVKEIKNAFRPLLERDIMSVADELEQKDRQAFDELVIKSFGLKVSRDQIYENLLSLLGIRLTAIMGQASEEESDEDDESNDV